MKGERHPMCGMESNPGGSVTARTRTWVVVVRGERVITALPSLKIELVQNKLNFVPEMISLLLLLSFVVQVH